MKTHLKKTDLVFKIYNSKITSMLRLHTAMRNIW